MLRLEIMPRILSKKQIIAVAMFVIIIAIIVVIFLND
jgi:hypothetical protein